MSVLARRGRIAATSMAVLATTALAVVAPSAGASGHPAGLVNGFTLVDHQLNYAYDVAASPNGRAYIAWVSSTASDSTRKVHLCTLTVGATSCSNGIQTINPLNYDANDTDPTNIHVVLTNDDVVHILWYDTPGANGVVYEATALHGQSLSGASKVITDAPAFGELLAAEAGPGGNIWTVLYEGGLPSRVQVRTSYSDPGVFVHTPYGTGANSNGTYNVQLAFTSGTPVLTVEKYGSISTALHYAHRSSGGNWSSFNSLAKTWTGAGATLENTKHGLRVVTGVDDASYRPVIAKWSSNSFGNRKLTADKNNCGPSTHDGYADPSGRLLDASWECDDVTLTNYADAFHAAITRIHVSNTPTDAPEVASGTRGIATVVYSYQPNSGTGDLIHVAHVRLPDSTVTVSSSGTPGKVSVTGPRTCLPPVNVHVGVGHKTASGWTFKSDSLRLGSNSVGSTLDGAKLTPGKTYTLTGKATFSRNGNTKTLQKSLTFKTCANA